MNVVNRKKRKIERPSQMPHICHICWQYPWERDFRLLRSWSHLLAVITRIRNARFHEQREIRRKEIVNLFSTILLKEQEDYFLVTPAQKLKIMVDDAPFIAIDMEAKGNLPNTDLLFETNVGDYVLIGKDHPLWVIEDKPYIHVREGLNALLTRNVFYRLVDCTTEKNGQLWAHSCGESFSLGLTE